MMNYHQALNSNRSGYDDYYDMDAGSYAAKLNRGKKPLSTQNRPKIMSKQPGVRKQVMSGPPQMTGNRQHESEDENDHFILNEEGRLTKSRMAGRLKNSKNQPVHENLYSLSKKEDGGTYYFCLPFLNLKNETRARMEYIRNLAFSL
jgi:hypothetical protein